MPTEFVESMDLLIEQVNGPWRVGVVVDQVYAHYQESHPEFRHPRGGQAFYLRDTLYLGQWIHHIATELIDHDGIHVNRAMQSVGKGLAEGVFLRAPWEFNDLRRSGAPYVERDGVRTWWREPEVKRLSEEQLRAKHRRRLDR